MGLSFFKGLYMNDVFHYVVNDQIDKARLPGLIWPDFDKNSEMTKKLIKTKNDNNSEFWAGIQEVLQNDIENLPMDRFKAWATIHAVPLISMVRLSSFVHAALAAAENDELAKEALEDPIIGCTPEDFNMFFRIFNDNNMCFNRMQLYGHLHFTGMLEKVRNAKKIVEIGAGIGDMTDIIYKLGFTGEYQIFDIPELGQIQNWYHSKLGLENVSYTSNIEELENADVVIATFSLTEMSLKLRNQIVNKLKGSKNWLISYSKSILGLDNESWINTLPFKNSSIIDIPAMNWDNGNRYYKIN